VWRCTLGTLKRVVVEAVPTPQQDLPLSGDRGRRLVSLQLELLGPEGGAAVAWAAWSWDARPGADRQVTPMLLRAPSG